MPEYKAPLDDMRFVLNDVWEYENLRAACPQYSEHSPDIVEAVLEESAKINEQLLHPLNVVGDKEGCQLDAGKVKTPTGFKAAYQTYQEAGWPSITGDTNYGGQGFPHMLHALLEEMLWSSNTSFYLYGTLTLGVLRALSAFATDNIKTLYLPKLISGEWTGAMCLTESHCGTDLSLVRTKAEALDDDTYQLTGTKIFITSGMHDLTANIVHLVLARLPDAPSGVKGISLFLVPVKEVHADGSIGENNGVQCGSLEDKMGIKGSCTCVIHYDNAKGYLIGEKNRGLFAMFKVMNAERLSIGLQGLGLSEIAYQNAAQYAKDRLQGRAATGAINENKEADPLLVHPDIRKMLLHMRSFNEAGRALAVWVYMQEDLSEKAKDDTVRKQAKKNVELFTPVIKGFLTDQATDMCNLGLQVLGGHGYIKEWGMEQFMRDARIAEIYEGANGVQALDLVKRKIIADDAVTIRHYLQSIRVFIETHQEEYQTYCHALSQALGYIDSAVTDLLNYQKTDPNHAGAVSFDFLQLFGFTAFAYMWLTMLVVAKKSKYKHVESKEQIAEFYFACVLPKVHALSASIAAGAKPLMQMSIEDF